LFLSEKYAYIKLLMPASSLFDFREPEKSFMQHEISDPERLQILSYPDPRLVLPTEPIGRVSDDISDLARRMIDVMVESNGIGLAGPQVGVHLKLIVISLTGKAQDAEVFINPRIVETSGWSEMEEGCLSLPGVRAKVRRPAVCSVDAGDLEGNQFVIDATDMLATVLQHEIDHLNGVLFIDRLNTISRMVCHKAIKYLETEYAQNNRKA
jgi:peptide deformylase